MLIIVRVLFAINEVEMLIGIPDWSIFDSFPIDIHHIVFEVALVERAAHEFVDILDLEHVVLDSNDNINLSIIECVAY